MWLYQKKLIWIVNDEDHLRGSDMSHVKFINFSISKIPIPSIINYSEKRKAVNIGLGNKQRIRNCVLSILMIEIIIRSA